jgi:hypothetical protein
MNILHFSFESCVNLTRERVHLPSMRIITKPYASHIFVFAPLTPIYFTPVICIWRFDRFHQKGYFMRLNKASDRPKISNVRSSLEEKMMGYAKKERGKANGLLYFVKSPSAIFTETAI